MNLNIWTEYDHACDIWNGLEAALELWKELWSELPWDDEHRFGWAIDQLMSSCQIMTMIKLNFIYEVVLQFNGLAYLLEMLFILIAPN